MMKDICVFGAGVVWGAWDTELGGWVNRLRLFIDASDEDSYVYNLGVPGESSQELLERVKCELESRNPAIMLFSIGGVDSMINKATGEPNVTLEEFKNNIRAIIQAAIKPTRTVIAVGLPAIDDPTALERSDGDSYYSNESVKLYDAAIKEVSLESGIHFISIFDSVQRDEIDDGIYPNVVGHHKIFEIVRDFLIDKKLIGHEAR